MRGVLGLDLAKTTGVAWIGDQPTPRPWETSVIRLSPKGAIQGEHYFVFQKRVDELIRLWKPELVTFEQVDFIGQGRNAFRINSILCGIVMIRCESFGIPYLSIGVSALKKFAGHGHATKEQMAGFARTRLFATGILQATGLGDATHDELDALWTAWWGMQQAAFRRSA